MSFEKLVDKLSKLSLREVESEELEQPIASSYEELVSQIVSELSREPSLTEDKLRIVKNALAVLIQRRIAKILQKLVVNEEVPRRLLYREERRLVELFEQLSLERIRGAATTTSAETVVEVTPEGVKVEEAKAEVTEESVEEVKETGKTALISGLPEEINIVVFREDFPALHSVTMQTLGPFSRFDIAALPVDDAEELRRKGVVALLQA